MIFIDSQVSTDDGMWHLVSELFIWMVQEGNVVFCITAGAGRVTPGTTPGGMRGGKPVEHKIKTAFKSLRRVTHLFIYSYFC